MNVVRCIKGHFYDADKFPICPHCQEDDMENSTMYMPDISDDSETLYMPYVNESGKHTQQPDEDKQAVSQSQHVFTADSGTDDDDPQTIGIFRRDIGTHPVVGWLVCIRGEAFGRSFPLREGRNFIGRGTDMDVVLSGDKAVSRDRHACIIYEPRTGVFYAVPENSHELFYLNEHVVLGSEVLKPRDVLLLGETELLFVPLCGPDFRWENLKTKN